MAYGLQIFGPSGQTWFDSTLAGAGVPVDAVSVPPSSNPYTKSYSGLTGYTLSFISPDILGSDMSMVFSYPGGVPTVDFYNYNVYNTGTILLIAVT